MTAGPPVAGPRRAALAFIFVTVVLDVVAFGVAIPVYPKLIEEFLGGDTPRAARLLGVFATVWALMQFLCSPILGALSDRFGRRPVILYSLAGLGLDYLLMAVAPSLGWLFVGRILSGMTAASWTSAGAYIADVTKPGDRAAGFGMIGAAWGLGFVLGPALGGLLGGIDLRLPFWVAGGLALVNALYGVFVLPESLPPERRRRFSLGSANPIGSLALLRARTGMVGLAAVFFLHYVAHNVLPSVFVLYAGHRYGWDARAVGLSLTVIGVATMVVQGGLVKPIVARLGERRALLVGLGCEIGSYALFGLAATAAVFWVGVVIGAFAGLFGPSIQALMSQRVDPSEQGQLQGTNSALMGVAGLLGPGIFTFVFAQFIRSDATPQVPGAPFLVASGIVVIALLIALRSIAGAEPKLAVAGGSDQPPVS
jgi:DHA1 family tetracycline resistance protein-like MFS transporter